MRPVFCTFEVVHEDTLCGLRTEVDGGCTLRGRAHFGLKHEVELAHFSPVASTADGANDFLIQDDWRNSSRLLSLRATAKRSCKASRLAAISSTRPLVVPEFSSLKAY